MDTHVHAIDPDQRPRVLGVTACIGGAEDVPQSLERIRALEKAMGATVFSSFHLTEASQLELKEYSARVEEVTCPVQVNELETWFEEQCSALLNTLTEKWKEERDRSSRPCQAGQKPGWKLAGVMERSVSFVDEALRLATDAGVYEALSWLGREYLSLLLDPRTTSEAEPLLPWLQFKFNNSCLFEDLRTALPTCPPEFVDEDGYARKMITNKQIAFVDKVCPTLSFCPHPPLPPSSLSSYFSLTVTSSMAAASVPASVSIQSISPSPSFFSWPLHSVLLRLHLLHTSPSPPSLQLLQPPHYYSPPIPPPSPQVPGYLPFIPPFPPIS
eukprot:1809493-Rhodomonas_salina.1